MPKSAIGKGDGRECREQEPLVNLLCKMQGGEEKICREKHLSGRGCPLIGLVGLVMSGILIEIVEPLEDRGKITTLFTLAPA